MKRSSLAVLLVVLSSLPALSKPFGLGRSTPFAALSIDETWKDGRLLLKSVPNPHPDFDRYVVLATANDGVCAVQAFSGIAYNDPYARRAKELFDRVRQQLESTYGSAAPNATINRRFNLDTTRRWPTTIRHGERLHQVVWTGQFQDNVRSVTLSVEAHDMVSDFVELAYQFDNVDNCKAAILESAAKKL